MVKVGSSTCLLLLRLQSVHKWIPLRRVRWEVFDSSPSGVAFSTVKLSIWLVSSDSNHPMHQIGVNSKFPMGMSHKLRSTCSSEKKRHDPIKVAYSDVKMNKQYFSTDCQKVYVYMYEIT